jgi:hypothetical protein
MLALMTNRDRQNIRFAGLNVEKMVMGRVGEEEVSVAEILLVLSLGADLGMGQPMEQCRGKW